MLRGGLDLEHGRDLVARDANDAALLGERIEDALSHPPDGVGNELEAFGVVKPARRLDQAGIGFGHEVLERQPEILVLLGHGDAKPQVGHDELVDGAAVAVEDPGRQLGFAIGVDHGEFLHLGEVAFEGRAVAVGKGLGDDELLHDGGLLKWEGKAKRRFRRGGQAGASAPGLGEVRPGMAQVGIAPPAFTSLLGDRTGQGSPVGRSNAQTSGAAGCQTAPRVCPRLCTAAHPHCRGCH